MDFGLKVPEGSADYVLQKRADLESLKNQGYQRNSAKAFIYSGRYWCFDLYSAREI